MKRKRPLASKVAAYIASWPIWEREAAKAVLKGDLSLAICRSRGCIRLASIRGYCRPCAKRPKHTHRWTLGRVGVLVCACGAETSTGRMANPLGRREAP